MSSIIPIMREALQDVPDIHAGNTGGAHDLIVKVNGINLARHYNNDEVELKRDILRVCIQNYCKATVSRRGESMAGIYRIRIWKPDLTDQQKQALRKELTEKMTIVSVFKLIE